MFDKWIPMGCYNWFTSLRWEIVSYQNFLCSRCTHSMSQYTIKFSSGKIRVAFCVKMKTKRQPKDQHIITHICIIAFKLRKSKINKFWLINNPPHFQHANNLLPRLSFHEACIHDALWWLINIFAGFTMSVITLTQIL